MARGGGVSVADARERVAWLALAGASLAWLAVRLYAARTVGFGDSEALYACYALHPQPAYLDHPALIGVFARLVGGGGAPTPAAAHRITSVVSVLVPWLVALASRAAGTTWRVSLWAAFAFAMVPEIAVGLFAMTPDLLLALTWTSTLAAAAAGLRAPPGSARASWLLAFAGVLAGAACASKATGGLLFVALVVTYASRPARAHARTIWPWAGLVAGAIVVLPIVVYEAQSGFPMLRHRLVDTQSGAGLSLRNVAALAFGQLAYLSPLYAVAAFIVARDLVAKRSSEDAVDRLLFAAFAIPCAALVALALWSRVAEPHWLAPPLLALPMHAARASSPLVRPRLARATVASGVLLSIAVYLYVLVPGSARLLPAGTDARFDLANELYGWPQVVSSVRHAEREALSGSEDPLPVVGPHWVVCAQLHAALGPAVPIGCDTPVVDDFDGWLPRRTWSRADAILFVTDSRYPVDVDARFPDRTVTEAWQITQLRGGRPARTFTVHLLERRAAATR